MSTIFYQLTNLLAATGGEPTNDASPTSPIYKAIDLLGPYVLGVCALLCMIYGIILGVRLAKAEDKEERKKCQKTLINFIIGGISVLVLLVILYAIRDVL